jgi:hypothetical protein
MSKSSSKQHYTQIKSWLDTFKKSIPKTNEQKKESRLEYYSKKGN